MKKYFIFIGILCLSFLFRIIHLDKIGGLWYDEATIYSIASQAGISGMFNADSHRFLLFPLYYLIYHCWINLFGNSDIIIRFMSVFFDMLAIITAFFTGKELGKFINKDSAKVGFCYMALCGINSTFIYYAQEAKFYSLTFFLINLVLIFWLKFLRSNSNKNLYILTLLNITLLLTYTSQILFILLLFFATIFYMLKNKELKTFQISILSISFLPAIIFSILFKSYYSGNFDAVTYDNSFILLAIQNWFSPLLAGLQNNIPQYNIHLLNNIFNIQLWIFVIFPVSFILYAIINSLKNYKITRYIFSIGILYVIVHIYLTIFSNHYTVLVRYTLPILPLLLLTASAGIELKKKILISLYIIVNIFAIVSITGAPNIPRPDGYKVIADTLKAENISPNFNYILPIRTNLLDKYFNIQGKRISLYILNSVEAQQTYLNKEEINNPNKYHKLQRFLCDENISKEFENYVYNNFISNNNLILLKDNSITMFSNEQIKAIVNSENYQQYPIQFLQLSKLNNDLITILSKKMHIKQIYRINNWEIFIFEI